MTQAHTEALLSRLERGWKPDQNGPAIELVHSLGTLLNATTEVKVEGYDSLEFKMALRGVRLRGADNIRGLIVAGATADVQEVIRAFAGVPKIPGAIFLVISASAQAAGWAKERMGRQAVVVITPGKLLSLLTVAQASIAFKRELKKQLGRRRLLPFDIEHPVAGNMFVGRGMELEKLSGSSSVAIAGPGRIGKTSLLTEHRRRLLRTSDPRAHTTFFIDFYAITDKSKDGVARFLASKLNPIRKSFHRNAEELLHFFRSEPTRLGAPAELLLDEVDEVISSDVFDTLAMAAREGLCQLGDLREE